MSRTTTRITRLLLAALLGTALCACGGGLGDEAPQKHTQPIDCTQVSCE